MREVGYDVTELLNTFSLQYPPPQFCSSSSSADSYLLAISCANNWYQRLRSCDNLDPIYYTRRQKTVFGTMDPNIKLFFEEGFKQLCAEIKEGFAVHEAAFSKRLEVATANQLRDTRVTVLEQIAASFDKSLSDRVGGRAPHH
jgi:hypothetical protein